MVCLVLSLWSCDALARPRLSGIGDDTTIYANPDQTEPYASIGTTQKETEPQDER